MSEGVMKGVNPNFSAPLITAFALSVGSFYKTLLSIQEGSI